MIFGKKNKPQILDQTAVYGSNALDLEEYDTLDNEPFRFGQNNGMGWVAVKDAKGWTIYAGREQATIKELVKGNTTLTMKDAIELVPCSKEVMRKYHD